MNLSPDEIERLRAESKRPTAYGIVISFTILSFILVCMRMTTRFFIIKNPGLEDYFIVVAMAASIAMAACMIKQSMYGTGLHLMFLTLPQVIGSLRYLFGSIISYNVSITCTKLSILLQYRRLFVTKTMRRAIWFTMGFVTVYGTWAVVSAIFNCIPVYAFWDVRIQPTAKCIPQFRLWYANGALNIISDLMIASLPLPVIRSLQMPKRHKIALMVIFGIGWFVCVVSILRLHALTVLERHMDDSSWYSQETAYWSAIECNIGIVCACLPILKPMVSRFIPRFGSSRDYGNYGRSGGTGGINSGRSKPGKGRVLHSHRMANLSKSTDDTASSTHKPVGFADTDNLTSAMSRSSIDLERGECGAGGRETRLGGGSLSSSPSSSSSAIGIAEPRDNQIKVTMDIVQNIGPTSGPKEDWTAFPGGPGEPKVLRKSSVRVAL